VGDVCCWCGPTRNVSTKDLQELTSLVAGRADRAPLPPIREYLPKEDLVNATASYALGPIALQAAAESVGKPEIVALTSAVWLCAGRWKAMLAQYHHGTRYGVLLLIDYPTPQLAELHMRHLETALSEGAENGWKRD